MAGKSVDKSGVFAWQIGGFDMARKKFERVGRGQCRLRSGDDRPETEVED